MQIISFQCSTAGSGQHEPPKTCAQSGGDFKLADTAVLELKNLILDCHFRCSYDFDVPEFAAVSGAGKEFISSLLVKEPSKRLSATEVINHKPEDSDFIVFREILLTLQCNALCAEPGPRLAGGAAPRPWRGRGDPHREPEEVSREAAVAALRSGHPGSHQALK